MRVNLVNFFTHTHFLLVFSFSCFSSLTLTFAFLRKKDEIELIALDVMIMEVLITPSFGIDMSSSQACVRDSAQDNHAALTACLFSQNDDPALVGSGLGIHPNDESSDNSSSIGAPDDSEDEEDDASSKTDETQSSRALGSLDSLEESLPIK